MKQVLVNLMMNAIEAIEATQASGILQITTRAVNGTVEVEVANTGPPIDPRVAQTLFMPFTTTKVEGTGLGMAVVNQIVVEHNGTIDVAANEPWGGIFTIRLPVQQAKPTTETPPAV
jgi:signal transduction histidine kinase